MVTTPLDPIQSLDPWLQALSAIDALGVAWHF